MIFFRKITEILRRLFNIVKSCFLSAKTKKDYLLQLNYFRNNCDRFNLVEKRPILNEKNMQPLLDRHYFYHPSWAARVLSEIKPEKHVDISSILRFVGDVSAFIPVDYYEYNLPDIQLDNLTLNKVDLLNLPFQNNSIKSLSCMHVIEHVGLGRYGDTLDVDGDLKAATELKRVLAIGGNLLVVVPVSGKYRIEFNAHRIYSYDMVIQMFSGLQLKEFALIPDKANDGGLIRNADPKMCIKQNYACGCFHFIKEAQI